MALSVFAGFSAAFGAPLVFATAMLAPPMRNPMSAADIHHRIIGNSITSAPGQIEFIGFDGAVRGRRGGVAYAGSWTLDGDRFCLRYAANAARCFDVTMRGDRVIYLNRGRRVGGGQLVAGNPEQF